MDPIGSLTDNVKGWLERLLLKGLFKIDDHDLDDLRRYMLGAEELEMTFLFKLLQELETEGKRFSRELKNEGERLTERYMHVVQYVSMIKQGSQ